MLSETYLVNAEAQTWLDFIEEPAVSLRFRWHQVLLKRSFQSDTKSLFSFAAVFSEGMKTLLLLDFTGWRAAK